MKQFLFIQHQAPHKTIAGQEGLDAILMGSAFVNCSVLLMDDGVFQLMAHQQTSKLGVKNYSLSYKALPDYGVVNIYCCKSHLALRGLKAENFVMPVQCLDDDEIKAVMKQHDIILSF